MLGSGDWFDVLDSCLLLDNYICSDATSRARSISKTFCRGRVEYNGRGLVHQLDWEQNIGEDRWIEASSITPEIFSQVKEMLFMERPSKGLLLDRIEQAVITNTAAVNGLLVSVLYLLRLVSSTKDGPSYTLKTLCAKLEHASMDTIHAALNRSSGIMHEDPKNCSRSSACKQSVDCLVPSNNAPVMLPCLKPRAFEAMAVVRRLRGLRFT